MSVHLFAPPDFTSIADARRRFISSIDYGLESYRRQLATCMTAFDEVIRNAKMWEQMQPEPQARRLRSIFAELRKNISQVPRLWEANEILLRELCCTECTIDHIELFPHTSSRGDGSALDANADADTNAYAVANVGANAVCLYGGKCNGRSIETAVTEKRTEFSYDQIDQVFYHLVRDWSSLPSATAARSLLYRDGLLQAMDDFKPESTGTDGVKLNGWERAQVLVPGAALGRLVVEIAAKGVQMVEANELSYTMITVLHGLLHQFISSSLSSSSSSSSSSFYPYLSLPMIDEWSFASRLIAHNFPGADANNCLDYLRNVHKHQQRTEIKLQAGSFMDIYSKPMYKNRYDAVVTSFFIDTGADVLKCVAIISASLKVGGLWMNVGPLHYHSNETKVPLSFDLLKEVISEGGFELLYEKRIISDYSGESDRSMKPETYHVPLTVFRLVDGSKRFQEAAYGNYSDGDCDSIAESGNCQNQSELFDEEDKENEEDERAGEDEDEAYPSVNFVLTKSNR